MVAVECAEDEAVVGNGGSGQIHHGQLDWVPHTHTLDLGRDQSVPLQETAVEQMLDSQREQTQSDPKPQRVEGF